ncbi:LPS export ABC transporter periplasmic protein LptC [Synechococcales cyanobacterium C]|uniref:LPS export ABC transporter periplasmic protein LptC n=1 Tax=Petrachloros mirabilis ULC683 TaxID=2781853 RepID=A0A8K2A7N6_9CYAN|nr:LPS export ABC transporter periplasmic protein LptC [Petrachloros mirabilis]NCJ07114.1 LPS export ABC transporter periplasmic protein LptC [Petrachloros mirabilis ULC683]
MLTDVTLQQTDEQGRLYWQLHAQELRHSKAGHQAEATQITGTLYEKGKSVFQIAADQGKVQQAAQSITLWGNLTVTADEMVMQGQELEWQPQKGQMVMRGGFTLRHPQVQLWAETLQVSRPHDQIQAQGNVILEDAQAQVRLKTEQITWSWQHQQIQAGHSQPGQTQPQVEIEQLQGKVTIAHALAGSVELALPSSRLTLQDPAQISWKQPPLQIASRQLIWQIQPFLVSSHERVSVKDPDRHLTLVAGGGHLDHRRQVVSLFKGVEVWGWQSGQEPLLTHPPHLTSNHLTWHLDPDVVTASGNVSYRQDSPALMLRGVKAIGSLQKQTIHMIGGETVIEIAP